MSTSRNQPSGDGVRAAPTLAQPSAVRDLVAYALDCYWDELATGQVDLDVIGRGMVRELRVLARIASAELTALATADTSDRQSIPGRHSSES